MSKFGRSSRPDIAVSIELAQAVKFTAQYPNMLVIYAKPSAVHAVVVR